MPESHSPKARVTCTVCNREVSCSDATPIQAVRPALFDNLRAQRGDSWSPTGYICRDDLNALRAEHVSQVLADESGELTDLQRDVINSLQNHEFIVRSIEKEPEATDLGGRLSDKIAKFGGSWSFLISFAAVMGIWIGTNVIGVIVHPFDPYPFILLNLVLSCLASVQAPIIMMSQNRQETRDRARAESDYKINLKAELEIRNLHDKMDHLLNHQWQRLAEIQQVQLDLMQEILEKRRGQKT